MEALFLILGCTFFAVSIINGVSVENQTGQRVRSGVATAVAMFGLTYAVLQLAMILG